MENLLIFGNRPLIGLLNNNAAGLSSSELIGIKPSYKEPRYRSVLVSKHFFIVHFINFMYTSACPLI